MGARFGIFHTRRDRSESWLAVSVDITGLNRPAPMRRAWGAKLFARLSRTIGPRPSLKFADDVNLVTGDAGFTGFTMVDRLLPEGHRVVGIDKLNTRVAGDKPPISQRKTAVVVHRPDTDENSRDTMRYGITTTMLESLNVSDTGFKVFNLWPAVSARRANGLAWL